MPRYFTKMHGLGNNFIVVDNRGGFFDCDPIYISKLCNRDYVGADGVILIEESDKADYRMRIFNSDGSEAEMCGNGIRCFARYLYDEGLTESNKLDIETLAGIKKTKLNLSDGKVESVSVEMGAPFFERKDIPMKGEGTFIGQEVEVNGKKYRATAVGMGNPHIIFPCDEINEELTREIGEEFVGHELFPNGTNIGVAKVLSDNEIKLLTYERGVNDITEACGTNACAAVSALYKLGKTGDSVKVHMLGGDLQIKLDVDDDIIKQIHMTGPAEYSSKGELM